MIDEILFSKTKKNNYRNFYSASFIYIYIYRNKITTLNIQYWYYFRDIAGK